MLGFWVFTLVPFVLGTNDACKGTECNDKSLGRIIGGDITEPNTRPFQVALYMRVGTTGELGFCGGALVHQQWVITAAHCCFHDRQQVDSVQAIFGAHSLYDRYENGRRIVNVAEIVVHPDYDASTFANDIALLRLANVVQVSDTIVTVRLPYLSTVSFNFAGLGATISGWGIAAEGDSTCLVFAINTNTCQIPTTITEHKTAFLGLANVLVYYGLANMVDNEFVLAAITFDYFFGVTFVSPTLREQLVTVITDPLCNTSYFNQLPENTICGFASGAGTCKGDNGGPMTIFFNATEETILVGVASFVSSSGCNDNLPSVFTRTQRYLDWISEVTGIELD